MATFWERSDPIFRVHCYAEPGRRDGDRPRYRIRGTWRATGERSTGSAGSPREAVREAEWLWQQYVTGALQAPDPEPLTLEELCARWLDRGVRETTRQRCRQTTRALIAYTGKGRRPVALTPAVVRGTMESLSALAPNTQIQHWESLRALSRYAVARGWLQDDPTPGTRPDVQRPSAIRPWLDVTEWGAFLDACTPALRIRAELALETGLRLGEVAHARWDWVVHGVGRPSIHVQGPDAVDGWQPKTKKSTRAVPLSDRAQELMTAAKERWPTGPYVVSDLDHPVTAKEWCQLVRAACAAAGVTSTDYHGLRRSAGARWLLQGVPLLVVARLLGHSSVAVTERAYAGIADATLAAEIGRLQPVPRAVPRGAGRSVIARLRGRDGDA